MYHPFQTCIGCVLYVCDSNNMLVNKSSVFFISFSRCQQSQSCFPLGLKQQLPHSRLKKIRFCFQNAGSQLQFAVPLEHQQQIDMSQYNKMYVSTAQSAGPRESTSQGKPPCLNCRLIQMGSAISYGDNRCPQCGEFCG